MAKSVSKARVKPSPKKKDTKGSKEKGTKPELKVIELFAGVGGFRLGLEGYKGKSALSDYRTELQMPVKYSVVFSNQYEPSTKIQHATEIYLDRFKENGGIHFGESIEKVKGSEIKGNIDLLVGGFPCQDYSVANSLRTSKGLLGKKGVLWWQIERLLSELGSRKPKYLILENVDRLLKSPVSKRGRDFSVMLASLNDLGYIVEWRIINAADYGMPQRRRRVFIVGYLSNTPVGKVQKKAEYLDWLTETGIVGKAFPAAKKGQEKEFVISGKLEEVSQNYGSTQGKSIFSNAGLSINRSVYTVELAPKSKGPVKTLGEVLVEDSEVPAEFWISPKDKSKWLAAKGSKKEPRTTEEGHEYFFSEGSMVCPDLKDLPSRTIITSEGGKTPSRTKHLVSHSKDEERWRRLLPVELEQLNMFPKNFTDHPNVNDNKRAFLMGNALVVGIIEHLGRSLGEFVASR